MKQVRDTKAGKSIDVKLVFNPSGAHVATVQAYYADSGSVSVDVYAPYELTHQKRATGYGYDKYTCALSGAVIDGHEITDHCGQSEPLPERGYFLDGVDTEKGWSLANGGYYVAVTGQPVKRFFNHASNEWEFFTSNDGSKFFAHYDVEKNPKNYTAVDADDVVYGYTSKHRRAGLDYLTDLGYTVITAI